MLTLEKFEEASEIVKKVTQDTKLVYSDYFSAQTGNNRCKPVWYPGLPNWFTAIISVHRQETKFI